MYAFTEIFISNLITNTDLTDKEKITALEELVELAQCGIKILSGKGIVTSSWLKACLNEIENNIK